MARIAISVFDRLDRQMGMSTDDELIGEGVETRIVFDGRRGPITARLHDLPPGATIEWKDSATGHLAYVWSGTVLLAGERLHAGSTIIVEHHAGVRAEGGPDGCILLVFNPAPGVRNVDSRRGGHVHVLPAEDAPRSSDMYGDGRFGAAIYADSTCPTCELWLHENIYRDAGFVVEPHYHSEDEVIVVTQGEIILGSRRYGPGTAVSVVGGTIYSFRTGEGGLAYINFRPCHPSYAPLGQREMIDERTYYAKLGSPRYHAPETRPR